MGRPAVVMGASTVCTFGMAPSTLMVIRPTVLAQSMQAATIMDNAPMVNIVTFALCQSLANPTVAAATSAALGVLTPMPCVPAPVAPWTPGDPTVMVGGLPALTAGSMCTCAVRRGHLHHHARYHHRACLTGGVITDRIGANPPDVASIDDRTSDRSTYESFDRYG